MKSLRSVSAALAAFVLTGSAFAFTPSHSASPATAPATRLVPSKIVNPSNLPTSFKRSVVEVEFSLDAAGQPQDIQVVSRSAAAVKEQVVRAFKQWKFAPATSSRARTEGQRFILPLEIVPEV